MSKKNLNEEEAIEGEVMRLEEVEIEAIIFFRPLCQPSTMICAKENKRGRDKRQSFPHSQRKHQLGMADLNVPSFKPPHFTAAPNAIRSTVLVFLPRHELLHHLHSSVFFPRVWEDDPSTRRSKM
jgi:hypothetical protein